LVTKMRYTKRDIDELPGQGTELLKNFYADIVRREKGVGWDKVKTVDPVKVRVSPNIDMALIHRIGEPDKNLFLIINKGPGIDPSEGSEDTITLLDGWVELEE